MELEEAKNIVRDFILPIKAAFVVLDKDVINIDIRKDELEALKILLEGEPDNDGDHIPKID